MNPMNVIQTIFFFGQSALTFACSDTLVNVTNCQVTFNWELVTKLLPYNESVYFDGELDAEN